MTTEPSAPGPDRTPHEGLVEPEGVNAGSDVELEEPARGADQGTDIEGGRTPDAAPADVERGA